MSEAFLGEIRIVSFAYAPKGWAFCNGQLLPINQNQALFAILGTSFGGDGRVTFALPNLRGRLPMHASGVLRPGASGGEEAHTLSVQELPPHTHTLRATQADAHLRSPSGGLPGYAEEEIYARTGTLVSTAAVTSPVGAVGGAHPNLMPSLNLNFIIALVGIFPANS